jgi:hypothetical protein
MKKGRAVEMMIEEAHLESLPTLYPVLRSQPVLHDKNFKHLLGRSFRYRINR